MKTWEVAYMGMQEVAPLKADSSAALPTKTAHHTITWLASTGQVRGTVMYPKRRDGVHE